MGVETANMLKGLKTQIDREQGELNALLEEQKTVNGKINSKLELLKGLRAKFKSLTTEKKIVVSEHAILRYIERIMGVDLEEVRIKILPEDKKEMIKTLGNAKYPINGHSIVVKDNIVITVYPTEKGDK